MKGIKVELGARSYPIYVESRILNQVGQLAKKHGAGQKIALITDVNVAKYYREDVEASLERENFQVLCFILPEGEQTKSMKMTDYLYEKLIEANFDRNSLILSLGGGVVGDLAGFVAATFMRGVSFAQIPTTLLAQTDSSVGGKVGINLRLGKNLVGAFHQPLFVVIDPEVLKTLPQREIWAGMAEVVKYGLIFDKEFFEFLDEHITDLVLLKNSQNLEMVIEHCCSIKAHIVAADEKESGLRRILNYGHTIGHAIETMNKFAYLKHGEAIILGMRAMSWLSYKLNLLTEGEFYQVDDVLQKMKLPPTLPDINPKEILKKTKNDKKVADGILNVILLDGIGKAIVRNDISDEQLLSALDYLRKQILVKNISNQQLKTKS